MVVLHKLWSIGRQRVYYTSSKSKCTVSIILRTLSIKLAPQFMPCIGIHRIEITVSIDPAHVVHGCRNCSLDASIDSRCIKRHASPSTNTENADTLCIYIVTGGKIIDRCTEIFRIDVRRSHITGLAATFSRIGWIESNRQESTFCQCLRIQARSLFLHGTKWATDGNGRQFTRHILGYIQIGSKCNAVTVVESYLLMVYFITLWKCLVPLLNQIQILFHKFIIIIRIIFCCKQMSCSTKANNHRRTYVFYHVLHLYFFKFRLEIHFLIHCLTVSRLAPFSSLPFPQFMPG